MSLNSNRKSRNWLRLAVLLLVAATAEAHSVTSSWVASTTPGAHYHVWRAPCSVANVTGVCPAANEGTFQTVGTVSATTFTDATVSGNTSYSYYVTAFCPAGSCAANFSINSDSGPSNHLGAAVLGDPVSPPGTLTLTNIATNFTDTRETLTAEWHDQASAPTAFIL